MNWKQIIFEYAGQKYLGEIAREIWEHYRKKRPSEQAEESRSIPMDIFLMFIPSEVSSMPSPFKGMIEKGFVQSTFITDQVQKDSSNRDRGNTEALSTAEIKHTSRAIADRDLRTALPDLDNFLFRDGMTKKEFTWHQLLGMLNELPKLYSEEEIKPFLALKRGKILYWERDFVNFNHRHPELYAIYQFSKELKPDKDLFCKTFQCAKVIFDRHPPFNSYILIYMPSSAGIIIAFQE